MASPGIDSSSVIYTEDGTPVDFAGDSVNLSVVKDKLTSIIDPVSGAIKTVPTANNNILQGMTSLECVVNNEGTLNKYLTHPKVVSESSCDSNTIRNIESGNKLIQIFKASHTNFDRVDFALNYATGTNVYIIDDFDSYTTEDEIEAVWVSTDENQINVDTVVNTVTNSKVLKMTVYNNGELDYVTKTYSTPQDFSAYTDVSFDWTQTVIQIYSQFTMQWIDSYGEVLEHPINILANNLWETNTYNISAFTPASGGTFDPSSVSKVRFYCETADRVCEIHVDNLMFSAPAASHENIGFELYGFDGEGEPTSSHTLADFTLLNSDHDEVLLEKRIDTPSSDMYTFHYERGVHTSESALTIGNYYAMVLTGINNDTIQTAAYNNTEESIQPYSSGKLFKVLSGQTTFIEDAFTSLMFTIQVIVPVYVSGLSFASNAPAGNSFLRIGKSNNGKFTNLIMDRLVIYNGEYGMLPITPTLFMETDYIVYIMKHDAYSDITRFNINIYFTYAPLSIWG